MIRKFELDDLHRILEIEEDSFPKSPYEVSIFLHYHKVYPEYFLVHVSNTNFITGYIIFYPDGNIASIAVDKNLRRKGIGTLLMNKATNISDNGYGNVEVRKSNTTALIFYNKLGFKKKGIIKDYYGNEDAVVLVNII